MHSPSDNKWRVVNVALAINDGTAGYLCYKFLSYAVTFCQHHMVGFAFSCVIISLTDLQKSTDHIHTYNNRFLL